MAQTGTRKVVIIGAGQVGSTFAYALQISGAAGEIVLVDLDRELAEAEALDMNHGLFFTPPAQIRAGDYDECADADIVVITAGASQEEGQSRMELVDQNVTICRSIVDSISEYTTEAILLMVTNPVDVLTYAALKCSDYPPERVIGAGTVLDTSRFRYLLSRNCRVDPHNVHGYVLGEHGDSEVIAWSIASIAGMKLDEKCPSCPRLQRCNKEGIAEDVRNSAYHLISAKGATNWAVGLALVRIVTAILRDEKSVLTVSSLINGSYGIEDLCLSIPAVLGSDGVEDLIRPGLSEEDEQALRASAEAIDEVLREVNLK